MQMTELAGFTYHDTTRLPGVAALPPSAVVFSSGPQQAGPSSGRYSGFVTAFFYYMAFVAKPKQADADE